MKLKLPGLIDCHVHLRVPGGEHKEDFISGTKAAIAGGFTTILAMPNTQPPITRLEYLIKNKAEAKKKAYCNILFFAGASPDEIDQLPELSKQAVALKIYMNDTFGPLRMTNRKIIAKCIEIWGQDKVIAVHAEGRRVDLGIELAKDFNAKIHFCHVSRKSDIEKIAIAKQNSLRLSCEVTPHHLFLTEEDANRLGPFGYMKPSLGAKKDQDALWDHIDTTIDCVGSDHAPHTISEKLKPENIPPGVPGLETTLPLMLTAVNENRLTLERVISLLHTNPIQIFNLNPINHSWIEVNLSASYQISNEKLYTKCGWSPFSGMTVTGKVDRVVIEDTVIYEFNKFIEKEKENE